MAIKSITPFLWFDGNAEEAANYYVSLFEKSRVTHVSRYGDSGRGPKGSAMVVGFELAGQRFTALNGGPAHKLSEAFSLLVNCTEQTEIDDLWEKLSEGGEKGRCGWLKDKYGLSWQVIPSVLGPMLSDKEPVKAKRVLNAMLQMNKIEINVLEQAYDQR